MTIYSIDQSLTGFAHCVLVDGESRFLETIDTDKLVGMARVKKIIDSFTAMIIKWNPDLVTIEDYAFTANTNTITQLAELVGMMLWHLDHMGYGFGWADAVAGRKALVKQTQARMKKFCLGDGAAKKDSRYLLNVMERIKKSFADDNQADAYMHAYTASITLGVMTGKVPIGNLTSYQQESLISAALKRKPGMSITKAMKLSDADKMKLVTP